MRKQHTEDFKLQKDFIHMLNLLLQENLLSVNFHRSTVRLFEQSLKEAKSPFLVD